MNRFSGLFVVAWMLSSILAGIFDFYSIVAALHHMLRSIPAWWPWMGGVLTIVAIALLPPKGTEFIAD